jgi:hypothetical protein
MRTRPAVVLLPIAAAILLSACGAGKATRAVMLTDIPEMTQYVEVFNAENPSVNLEVRYSANLAKVLRAEKEKPALVVGKWLKSSKIRYQFRSLDRLCAEQRLDSSVFYKSLLSDGRAEGRQVLLPVSFNLPAVIFLADNRGQVAGGAMISAEDIRRVASAYNEKKDGELARIGFSPRWDLDFLYVLSRLNGAAFREGKPLAWNQSGLEATLNAAREWAIDNGNFQTEDDYQYKYLQAPSSQIIAERRAFFAYEDSRALFTLPEEKRSALDFRWLSQADQIPVCDDAIYLGACRQARGERVADIFVAWFFSEATQKRLLAQAKEFRTAEISFGIADGFSAMKSVNERDFPALYPSLMGHLPPEETLLPPPTLSQSWPELRTNFVEPLLHDLCSQPAEKAPSSAAEIQKRLALWLKENPLP